jgi:hypothetical protein
MSHTVAVPYWTIYLFITCVTLLLFSLWATRRGEKSADLVTRHLIHVIKGLLLQRKEKQVYIANCYLVQSDDVGLYFTVAGDGINVILSGGNPNENSKLH